MMSDIGQWYELVPIRVGMILVSSGNYLKEAACPHTRGDDPRF